MLSDAVFEAQRVAVCVKKYKCTAALFNFSFCLFNWPVYMLMCS